MNQMQDEEVRRMVLFTLRQAARQIARLESYTDSAATRACCVAARAALSAAVDEIQNAAPNVIEGDDEARLVLR
jgi:hypothetical protein